MMWVSVIISCYNSASFLEDSINSVLNQSFKELEIIIVNDGSTDDTDEKISQFLDSRIKYYKIPRSGQSEALNFGLSVSSGDYIKFFDSDDIMNITHIEDQLNAINESRTSIASCSWSRFYNNNLSDSVLRPESVWKDMESFEWLKQSLSQKNDMMPGWLWLIPRNILEITKAWDNELTLNNDLVFSTKLLLNTLNVKFVNSAHIYYRSGNNISLSNRNDESSFKKALLATDIAVNLILAREDTVQTRLICANRYQKLVYQFYPKYPELLLEIKTKIYKLGGSNVNPQLGGKTKFISHIVGWENTFRIKAVINKLSTISH
jgi:glycosyltransferase involved in cell wall biosynthesis